MTIGEAYNRFPEMKECWLVMGIMELDNGTHGFNSTVCMCKEDIYEAIKKYDHFVIGKPKWINEGENFFRIEAKKYEEIKNKTT